MGKLVGIAYPEWLGNFKSFYPNLKVYKPGDNIEDYGMMIFPGGSDVSPSIYNKPNLFSHTDPQRDSVEVPLLTLCLDAGIGVLGICRGHQLINAALGGVLTQDLQHPKVHDITWLSESPIKEFYPRRVNSLHHQGYYLNQISPKLTPIAAEPVSGLIEAACSETLKIITVQWHPEILIQGSNEFFSWIQNEYCSQ